MQRGHVAFVAGAGQGAAVAMLRDTFMKTRGSMRLCVKKMAHVRTEVDVLVRTRLVVFMRKGKHVHELVCILYLQVRRYGITSVLVKITGK